MPAIDISESQEQALEEIRADLAEKYIDKYGHIRIRDVIQFLIDFYNIDNNDLFKRLLDNKLEEYSYPELQSLAGRTEGVEPSGTQEELRERLATTIANDLFAINGTADENSSADTAQSSPSTEETEATESEVQPAAATAEQSTATAQATTGPTAESEPDPTTEPSGNNASRLQQMMDLLEQHDDRWEQVDSEDGRYAVTLPDGSTETVRTKDDVRAVLFQHY